jgi:hypothetical protein
MEKCGRVGGRHPRRCNDTNGNGKEEEELTILYCVRFSIEFFRVEVYTMVKM